MAYHFKAGESALWYQHGPNTEPLYLGCHELGDIEAPEGDIELIFCPDPDQTDKFHVVGSVQQAAGAVTTEVTGDVTDELDELEKMFGTGTLFVNKIKKGRRDLFSNWDRTFILRNVRRTSRTLTAMAVKSQDDNARSEQTFALSAEELIAPMRLDLARQTISEVNAINDIVFCNQKTQRTDDSPAQDSCQVGFAATDPTALGTANVLVTTDGATWTAAAADPFAADEVVIAVECFEPSRDIVRVIVAAGTTDADDPAKIAYSDDSGTSWTTVFIGTVDGQFIPARNSLFVLDRGAMWVGMDDGYIYKSADAGLTWTAQEAGVINSGPWNAIHFANRNDGLAGGDNNEIARTVDGGSTWSAVTGPSGQTTDDIQAVWVLDKNRYWIAYNDGTIWFTLNAGVDWSQRSFTGSGTGSVRDIAWLNDLIGFLAHNDGSSDGTIHMTVDGGYSWERLTGTPVNNGFNKVVICELWKIFFCGEAESTLGFIGKGSV